MGATNDDASDPETLDGISYARAPSQQYDHWLLWSPNKSCNLDCDYCRRAQEQRGPIGALRSAAKRLLGRGDREDAGVIDAESAMRSLDEIGGVFRITFTGGGEPFLVRNIIEASQALSRKHFLSFNTNLTLSRRLALFAEAVDPSRVLFLHASLHIRELERTKLTGTFVENHHALVRHGFRVIVGEVGHPSLLPDLPRHRDYFRSHGIEISFSRFFGVFAGKRYPEAHTDEELAAFHIDPATFRRPLGRCIAGGSAARVDKNGDVFVCGMIDTKLGNIYTGFRFKPTMTDCAITPCICPLGLCDPYLQRKGP